MALGIEQNSIAPQIIAQSGKMLSENIRDIGKQVQGAILEVNTKKDLARMAQEIQSGAVIPQSEDFAQQAIAFGFRHPLAIQDPRGQMALNILGKAHGEWRQQKAAEARINPYRSMSGGIWDTEKGKWVVEPNQRPMAVGPGGLYDPKEKKMVVEPRQLPQKNVELSPGEILVDPAGKEIAKNPKVVPGMTPYQSRTLALRKNAERRAAIKEQVDSTERDIRALEQSLRDDKMSVLPGEREEWQKQVEKLRDQRNQLLQQFNAPPTAEDITIEPELGAVPPDAAAPQGDGGVVPAVGAIAAPLPDANELVPVINPQGKPTRIRKSQLESALQNGYRTR